MGEMLSALHHNMSSLSLPTPGSASKAGCGVMPQFWHSAGPTSPVAQSKALGSACFLGYFRGLATRQVKKGCKRGHKPF